MLYDTYYYTMTKQSTNANCIALDTDLSGSIFKFIWEKHRQSLFNDAHSSDNENSDNETNPNIRGSTSVPVITNLNNYIMYYLCGYTS